MPIDESAPKGRLILPQQQVIRECLDKGVVVTVCQPGEVQGLKFKVQGSESVLPFDLVITDSQAFGAVNQTIKQSNNPTIRLTSFSILFARQKGDLEEYARGLAAIRTLKDGDTVLVAEGCTHHRQCNDIGAVKVPKALKKLSGAELRLVFASGSGFPDFATAAPKPALVVQCGGCMLTRRAMMNRLNAARQANVPVVNYGLLLAAANGLEPEDLVV